MTVCLERIRRSTTGVLVASIEDEDVEAVDALLLEMPVDADATMVERALGLIRQELAGPGEWQIMVFLERLPVDVFVQGLLHAAAVLDEQSPFALRTMLRRRLEDEDGRGSLAKLMAHRSRGRDVIAGALRELASSHPGAAAVLEVVPPT